MAGTARLKLLHGLGSSRVGRSQPSYGLRTDGRTSILVAGRSGTRTVVAALLTAAMSRYGSLIVEVDFRLVLQVDHRRADDAMTALGGLA